MFGVVCKKKKKSQAYQVSRASITFLVTVHFSVKSTSVKALLQELLAVMLCTPGDTELADAVLLASVVSKWLKAGLIASFPHGAHIASSHRYDLLLYTCR